MAVSITPVPLISTSAPTSVGTQPVTRSRRITPEAGHALEILGHAIEYLTDEFVHEGGPVSAANPRLQAVQMLMALNRQIYFSCPEIAPFRERLRRFFHF